MEEISKVAKFRVKEDDPALNHHRKLIKSRSFLGISHLFICLFFLDIEEINLLESTGSTAGAMLDRPV